MYFSRKNHPRTLELALKRLFDERSVDENVSRALPPEISVYYDLTEKTAAPSWKTAATPNQIFQATGPFFSGPTRFRTPFRAYYTMGKVFDSRGFGA